MRAKTILMMSAGLLVCASAAQAQTTQVDEIIVTAEKRSVSLQDVPVAVSAYTAEARQVVGLDSLREFTNFTPGLSFSAADDRVFVRGVGRQTNTNGSDPGVATYSDGVYDAATSSAGVSDFFVERVEILRGPQGTLYGRNSIGGAINAISRRPTSSLSGEVRATVGDYGVMNFEAAVSGPLTEGLRVRLAGARYNQEDGYFTNAAGGPSEGGAGERRNVELQVEADLGGTLSIWTKLFAADSDLRPRSRNVAGPYDYATYPTTYIAPGSAVGYTTIGYTALGTETTNPGMRDIRRFSTDTPQTQQDNAEGIALEVVWNLPSVDVKYVGGYQSHKVDLTYDYDNTSMVSYYFPLDAGFSLCNYIPGCTPLLTYPSQLLNFREDKTFGSNELNLSSSGGGPVQWIVGIYRYAEELDQQIHFNAPNQPQLRAPANGPANPLGDFVFAGSTLESRSLAVFGQVDWSLSDTVSLTAGLRYTHDEKEGFERLRIICFSCGGYEPGQYGSYAPALDITGAFVSYAAAPGVVSPVVIDPVTGMARRELAGSWNATTGTLGIQWKRDDDTLAFARYSRGYKAGGFNAGGISVLPQTDSEKIDAFEVGYKRTFGSRLQINTALFHYSYQGLQIPLTVTIPGGASLTEFFNLDESTSYGAEVEAVWWPADALQLLLSYGYGRSEIDEACCFVDGADPRAVQPGANPEGAAVGGQQPQNIAGQELPQTPRHKVALNANYRFEFDAGSLVLSGSYVWKAKTYQSVFNRSYNQSPAYDQVDLRAVWTTTNNRYRVIGFVKNLFDETGYDGSSGMLLAAPPATPETVVTTYGLTPPRTVGLQFQYRFN